MVMVRMDKIFKKKERDYSDFEIFFLFKIDFISFIWWMLRKKKDKNYNKSKFKIRWDILKDKD